MRRSVMLLPVLSVVAAFAAGQQVPAEHADLYAYLGGKLEAFDSRLDARWDGTRHSVTFAAELLTANGNRGLALLAPQALIGVRLELDRLKGLGLGAVTVSLPFPILDAEFMASGGNSGKDVELIAFYAAVVAEAHARGLKVAIESGAMFPGAYSAGSGLDAASYYPTLTWNRYVIGRADHVVAIARDVRPDFIGVGSEPDTEADLSGQDNLRAPAGFAAMVSYITDRVAGAGVSGVPVLAGVGTWTPHGDAFVEALCGISGLWGIDLHQYPVNLDFLDRGLALAELARARGKRVTFMEAWLQKETDAELATLNPAFDTTIYARDSYSFWAPLDTRFLEVMVKLAHVAEVDMLSPFWSRYFWAYLDHAQVASAVPPLTSDQVVALSTQVAAAALVSGSVTSTGMAYSSLARPRLVRRQLRSR
ncbi:MAG: hypothetical protein ACOY3Y_00720 [Acidobacteriota bacterium]